MSRSADVDARRRDEGFTMIEIIVSIGVFAVVLVALLPQLIVGIKATGTARVVSQAKGVGQGQLERMRHLPFHIAPEAGDYVDVLDRYYPNLTSAGAPTCMTGVDYRMPASSWQGYVAPGATRCDYEPSTGAFYRTVTQTAEAPGIRGFTVIVDTQFLSGATPPQPVTPPTGYDTGNDAKDNPPSSQVGVTVTVFYERDGGVRPVTVHSQLAQRLSGTQLVRSDADVRVVEIGSVTESGVPMSLQAGLLHLAGSVSYASTAKADLVTVSGELADGTQRTGAALSAEAPPAQSTVATTGLPQYLEADCALACWGGTSIPTVALAADDGQPNIGGVTAPAQVRLVDPTHGGLSFDNSRTDSYISTLGLATPLVGLDTSHTGPNGMNGCAVGTGGGASYLAGSGYLRTSDPETSLEVEACGVARSNAVKLFPTSFAPDGVVQVELERASARCLVSGAGHTPDTTYNYRAIVRHWNGSSYTVAATVVPGQTADALAALPLTTPVGGGHVLGDYISSWSSVKLDDVVDVDAAAGGVAQLKVPGVVRIVSQPVRPGPDAAGDELSAVSLTVGALSCHAEDRR